MRGKYEDWKDIASEYYPKALSLAILMVLFAFLVSPKMEIKPYQHKEIKVQAIDIPPEIKDIIKPPEEQQTPQVRQVIIDDSDSESDDDDAEIVETIDKTVIDMSEQANAPVVKIPSKFTVAQKMPVPIKQVAPKYPENVKKLGIEGTVVLMAVVDKKGNVIKVELQKSVFKTLDDEAKKALKQWKFSPAENNGKPLAVWVTIPFEFSLH